MTLNSCIKEWFPNILWKQVFTLCKKRRKLGNKENTWVTWEFTPTNNALAKNVANVTLIFSSSRKWIVGSCCCLLSSNIQKYISSRYFCIYLRIVHIGSKASHNKILWTYNYLLILLLYINDGNKKSRWCTLHANIQRLFSTGLQIKFKKKTFKNFLKMSRVIYWLKMTFFFIRYS